MCGDQAVSERESVWWNDIWTRSTSKKKGSWTAGGECSRWSWSVGWVGQVTGKVGWGWWKCWELRVWIKYRFSMIMGLLAGNLAADNQYPSVCDIIYLPSPLPPAPSIQPLYSQAIRLTDDSACSTATQLLVKSTVWQEVDLT